MKFGNLVLAGLVTGSIYAVFAVCVSVWYRVCNILNLAVGDFAMVGALGVDNLVRVRNWPLPAAIATTLAVVAVFGFAYDRVVLRLAQDGPRRRKASSSRSSSPSRCRSSSTASRGSCSAPTCMLLPRYGTAVRSPSWAARTSSGPACSCWPAR